MTVGFALLAHGLSATPAPITISVQADQPGAQINPAMWGIFFEDINFGADGGLYAELVKNRGFEFPDPMMGWKRLEGGASKAEISTDAPFDAANPHYLHIQNEGAGRCGVANEGFHGMGVRAGEDYDFSAHVREVSGSPTLAVELADADGQTIARTTLSGCDGHWQKLTASLHPDKTVAKAHMNLVVEGSGAVDFDMVSLFPRKTWKNRPGGLRADMVQMLADLKPGFLRFPGGCIVEGSELSRRYQWKKTLGPIEDRKLLINRWNYEFKHRPTPDYFQSFGLGFFEFFQLCEDIGAEPLPILNCGMACQFNTGQLVPLDQLQPYIQDAMDLIEFANGPATSEWGGKRAAMGHPAPFNLKMMGVGNEQWGAQYIDRYIKFARALKEQHPEVALVSAAGPSPADDRFQFLWPKLRELHADIVDEHCYANPVWFFSHSDRYDAYDRNGPKVFMGEYAAQSVAIVSTKNRNNLECALAEAAYMTGLERNADVVRMASYAPLFANVDAWQWVPDLIWADNLRVYGTVNYYAQELFMHNRGDVILPTANDAVVTPVPPNGRIGLGTEGAAAEFKDVRVTRGADALFSEDFAKGDKAWQGTGVWSAKGGVFRQQDANRSSLNLAGDTSWGDYTLSLKARKVGGPDGLMVVVRAHDSEDYVAWRLGGWRNQFHGIISRLGQQDHLMGRVSGSLEPQRWYDVKLVLKGTHLNCYLDGQLVQSADVPVRRTPQFFASATGDRKSGDIILKVVNAAETPAAAAVQLKGLKIAPASGQATVLSSHSVSDENSFEKPGNVTPSTEAFASGKSEFSYTFKPYSLTVLRIPAGVN
jgi:alpha-L-arabinofuranosidase